MGETDVGGWVTHVSELLFNMDNTQALQRVKLYWLGLLPLISRDDAFFVTLQALQGLVMLKICADCVICQCYQCGC